MAMFVKAMLVLVSVLIGLWLVASRGLSQSFHQIQGTRGP